MYKWFISYAKLVRVYKGIPRYTPACKWFSKKKDADEFYEANKNSVWEFIKYEVKPDGKLVKVYF